MNGESQKLTRRSRRSRRRPMVSTNKRNIRKIWHKLRNWWRQIFNKQKSKYQTPLSRQLAGLSPQEMGNLSLEQFLKPIAINLENSAGLKILKFSLILLANCSIILVTFFYIIESHQQQENLKKTAQYPTLPGIKFIPGKQENGGIIQALQSFNQQRISLSGLNAEQRYLVEINLDNADLEGANLEKTNLRFAKFQKANLAKINLQEANLVSANFQGANLTEANFKSANLMLADFKESNIEKADFRKVKNLTIEQIKRAKNWKKAIFDQNFSNQLGL